jgi:hypothetical protein
MLIKVLINLKMRDMASSIRNYRKWKISQAKVQEDVIFLKKCRKSGVFPNFIQVWTKISNPQSKNAIDRAKKIWLKNEIKSKYAKLNQTSKSLYREFGKILDLLPPELSELLLHEINSIESLCHQISFEKKSVLDKKFLDLTLAENRTNVTSRNQETAPLLFVTNLSSQTFNTEQMELLNKGLKHKINPRCAPLEEIVANVEVGISMSNLSEVEKTSARVDCLRVLKQSQDQQRNQIVSSRDRRVLQEIRAKDVVVTRQDKGKGSVIFDRITYDQKVLEAIKDGPYEELKIDGRWKDHSPLNKMETEVNNLLKELKEEKGMSSQIYRSLRVSNPKMPLMYALPKVHKAGNPMRPIISNIKSPTSKIAKYVVKRFEDLNVPKGFTVKNTFEFVEAIKDVKLEEDEMMCSFDVIGLFPNIPLNLAFVAVKNFLDTKDLEEQEKDVLLSLSKICMEQNIFQFREKFYRQKTGTTIGNSASPLIADFFMKSFENDVKSEEWFPRIWFRYVDDVFAVVKKEKLEEVLNRLNSFHQTIQFTSEVEQEGKIPFLDLSVSRTNEGGIEFDIYRKPTDNQLFIRSDSYHHPSHKHAAFHSMFYRLFNIPMSQVNFIKEKDYIMETGKVNGYDEKILMRIFNKQRRKFENREFSSLTRIEDSTETTSFIGLPYAGSLTENLSRRLRRFGIKVGYQNPGKLSDLLGSLKDKEMDDEKKSGIYLLKCADCDAAYIGLSKRRIGVRKKEHVADCLKPLNEESAMAHHCICENHQIDNEIELLKEVNEFYKLSVWESLFLFKHSDLNLQNIYKEGNSPSILFQALEES